MKNPADRTSGGGAEVVLDDGKSRISQPVDLVISRHARRIRLHHVLVRRRRWCKSLDHLLVTDPWDRAGVTS